MAHASALSTSMSPLPLAGCRARSSFSSAGRAHRSNSVRTRRDTDGALDGCEVLEGALAGSATARPRLLSRGFFRTTRSLSWLVTSRRGVDGSEGYEVMEPATAANGQP